MKTDSSSFGFEGGLALDLGFLPFLRLGRH